MSSDTSNGSPELSLGAELALHRKRMGLSGSQLGEAVGMSQAKISRLETGAGTAEPRDVEAIARRLGLGEADVRRLVTRATDQAQNRMTDWRHVPQGLAGRQQRMGQIEVTSATVRAFQPIAVVGLAQTSEYARAVLASFDVPMFRSVYFTETAGIPEAVSARMKRQEILADRDKSFRFVMAEAALANRLCPPVFMPAQIQRVRDLAQQDNISIGIIPFERQWQVMPIHAFDLFDDQYVEIDLFNTGLTTQGKTDVRLYQQVFDTLEAQATTDIDPILDRYMDIYLDLSRPARRSAPPEQAGRGEADPSA